MPVGNPNLDGILSAQLGSSMNEAGQGEQAQEESVEVCDGELCSRTAGGQQWSGAWGGKGGMGQGLWAHSGRKAMLPPL